MSSVADLPNVESDNTNVWLFVLPYERAIADAERSAAWFAALRCFAEKLPDESVVAILTSSQDAAETLSRLDDPMQFQLWVALKLDTPIVRDSRQLPEHHAALLVFTKYRTSLRHTKTRIAYTFCPACDKTTKDYGGKKHTYHEYGTLVSDVWRDISYVPGKEPTDVATRLADLFGLDGYGDLMVLDLTHSHDLDPKPGENKPRVWDAFSDGSALNSQLINGDSLAKLRELPEDSVDFCFADPPYNLAKRYDSWDDAIDAQEYLKWCDDWLDELARVLRPGCTCAVLNIPILAVRHFIHMKQKLSFQSWIAWEGLSLPVRMIMPAHYAIICFSKGNPRSLPGWAQAPQLPPEYRDLLALRESYCVRQSCVAMRRKMRETDHQPITDLWWDIHRLKHNSRRVDHPCQLPPALMRRLIALFTYHDEVVLDPFNGAGTTTLCSASMGRRYIGIELSEKYHQLAQSRHQFLQEGGDPFEKVKNVPKAKNSRVQRIGGCKYEISKKALQLEVRRVAVRLGHLPSRNELEQLGQYPIRYYEEYFLSWGEVCAAARTTGMSEIRKGTVAEARIHQPLLYDAIESQ